ncbi:hypothetical protein XOC_0100 [Xanthomonas oryzae pv. oryzicola BLS256]|uniref:Uncharacterized protein n=1 Tax=Xanthomonas oryzae pv. oryzicola (strain BLS256) TaxID=383407 RepID=G7TIR5_XANOB|nr:hypothetical protein XOC_0100 [Xanthomonas oryzae pv. oryzicola BLS256]
MATRQTGAGGHACASPRETVACQCSRVRRWAAATRAARSRDPADGQARNVTHVQRSARAAW